MLALTIAVVAVAAGVALGLFSGRVASWLQPIYAFGVVAALVVVLGHLLPEAASELGLPALFVFAVGLMVPSVVERLAARPDGSDHPPVQVGFIALLLHQFGDGAALAAAAHAGAGLEVGLAVAAHTVPLVTLMTTLVARERGVRAAVSYAAGMAIATLAGAGSLAVISEAAFETVEPYAAALIAGVLLHVVLHAPPAAASRPVGGRLIELVAIGGGAALALVGSHDEHASLLPLIWETLLRMAFAIAPALLGGLVLASVVQAYGAKLPAKWMKTGPSLMQALRGAIVGVPLPVCTCGVLPTARALLERGAPPALLIAFAVAAPVLGFDTLLVTARFIDVPAAVLRIGVAVMVAMIAALAAARKRKPASPQGMVIRALARAPQRLAERSHATKPQQGDVGASFFTRALHHFDELVFHVVPWAAVGLLVAAYVDVLLPAGSLNNHVLDVLLVTLVSVPLYVSASAVTPVAAVLLLKGLSPGAALAGLVVGPATDIATIAFLRRSFGARATWLGLAGLVGGALACAFLVNASGLTLVPSLTSSDDMVSRLSLAMLVVLVVRSIWQSGIVAWAEALSRTPSLEWRVSRAYARL